MRKEFSYGQAIPWYYGLAYLSECRFAYVCYIIPFNWIARHARAIWLFFRDPEVAERKLIKYIQSMR